MNAFVVWQSGSVIYQYDASSLNNRYLTTTFLHSHPTASTTTTARCNGSAAARPNSLVDDCDYKRGRDRIRRSSVLYLAWRRSDLETARKWWVNRYGSLTGGSSAIYQLAITAVSCIEKAGPRLRDPASCLHIAAGAGPIGLQEFSWF